MDKIKPFENAGGFTTFHNAILDHIMPACKPNTWKVVCVVLRQTRGYQKDEDELSYSQIAEKTGIGSRMTLSKAIQDALDCKYILRREHKDSFKYRLNTAYELDSTETVPVQKLYRSGTETVPEPVQKLYTQKKKEILKETSSSNDENTGEPTPSAEVKKKSEFVLNMEYLEQTFANARGCALPDWDGDPKGANKRWRQPLNRMLKKTGDLDITAAGVEEKVRQFKADGLTFDAPDQIEKSFNSWVIDHAVKKQGTQKMESGGTTL